MKHEKIKIFGITKKHYAIMETESGEWKESEDFRIMHIDEYWFNFFGLNFLLHKNEKAETDNFIYHIDIDDNLSKYHEIKSVRKIKI